MALFNIDLFGLIRSFLGPFGKLLDYLKQSYDHLTTIFDSAQMLTQSVIDEVNAFRNFKEDVRFKQRVVNLETAIQKTRDLIEGIPAAWKAIIDIVQQFKKQITAEGNPLEEAEAVTEDLESGGITTLIKRFPALGRALERLLGVLALIVQALEGIVNTIDDLQTVVDEVRRLRLEIEKADTIFLSQSNPRRTVRLENGTTMRIRVGKLHS